MLVAAEVLVPLRLFNVCPEWAVTRWRKSATGLALGTVSWGQVRQSWGGVWSKPKANSWSDEQKSHIRHSANVATNVGTTMKYYNRGYKQAVDLDLAKYFDTVNHDILINMLREQIKDKRVISLIWKYLKSEVMINGLISTTAEGSVAVAQQHISDWVW